jgi:cyclic-di-GMP phosphodiesterase TipF (flagellum assembly factor)
MPRLSHALVLLIAGVTGLVTAALTYRMGGLSLEISLLAGALVVLAAAHLDVYFDAQAEHLQVREAIGQIASIQDQLRVDTSVMRRRMVDLAHEVEDKIATRNERLFSEVKVLEVLIRRLAEGIASKSSALDGGAGEHEQNPTAPALTAADFGAGGPDDAEMLEIVRRSLEDNRIDLYLQPIVSLPQRKIRYYEAVSRLRSEEGMLIMPAQYMRVAEPAGLMSIVDNVLLFRCVQIVRRLTVRNKELAVFCNISRYTLQDAGFFAQFLDFMQHNRDLAGLIIFEISQDTLDACGPIEDANLGYLAELGFAFSMDRVTSLDIDFPKLRERRVRFVKVPAKILLGDVGSAGSSVAGSDLKELLGRYGLNLIAERIEAEREVVNLLDYNVDFAQGFLFGEPRPIRETLIGEQALVKKTAPMAEWPKPFADPLPHLTNQIRTLSAEPPPPPPALRPSEEIWPRARIKPASLESLAVNTLSNERQFPKASGNRG